jgi:type II secretory pathway pseudopilin PulG
MRKHAARPFTLIELIAVMGVLILLAAVAIPAYSSLFSGRKTTLAANQLNGAVLEARAHAVSAKLYTALVFLKEKNQVANDPASKGFRTFRMAELYHDSDSESSPYKWRRWAPGSSYVILPENTMIPDKSGELGTVNPDSIGNKAEHSLPTISDVKLEKDSAYSAGNLYGIVFKPNGQLAGTSDENVVVRFVEANRYEADAGGTPKLPLNINWLTCKTKFLEPVQ